MVPKLLWSDFIALVLISSPMAKPKVALIYLVKLKIINIIVIVMIVMEPSFVLLMGWMFVILFMFVSDIIKISSLILVT